MMFKIKWKKHNITCDHLEGISREWQILTARKKTHTAKKREKSLLVFLQQSLSDNILQTWAEVFYKYPRI